MMKTCTSQVLKNLRQLMECSKASQKLNAYIVTTSDAHLNEYLADGDKRLQYLTGFSGSYGLAVVTPKEALLWTDGRYYLQASRQLDSNWTIMKMNLPSTPSIKTWLSKNLQSQSRIGIDPKNISYDEWLNWEKDILREGHILVPVHDNLIDQLWKDKPQFTHKSISKHVLQFAGVPSSEKIKLLTKELTAKNVDLLVINSLDEIAWLLNLRGQDVAYNPIFFSYLTLSVQGNVDLFVEKSMLPTDILSDFNDCETTLNIHAYNEVYDFIKKEVESVRCKIVWLPKSMNYHVYSLVPNEKIWCEASPILYMKAIKNEQEIAGMVQAHIKDAVALCRFYAWLEKEVPNGEVTEISAAERLEVFKMDESNYRGPSFPTISCSGPNSSVIHYQADAASNRKLSCKEIYLCDSGSQFLEGTTDITRTVHFGTPTDFERECFTRVFQGQTALACTVFPNKLKSNLLDAIPRKPLWDIGLNYSHGTSHGVGSFLCVHEGPSNISYYKENKDDIGLLENMMLSNEPGFYKEDDFGIRLENIVQIVPAKTPHNFSQIGYMTFSTLTLVPIQTKMLKFEMLSAQETKYINQYHQQCRDVIGKILKQREYQEAYDWLIKETQVIG